MEDDMWLIFAPLTIFAEPESWCDTVRASIYSII